MEKSENSNIQFNDTILSYDFLTEVSNKIPVSLKIICFFTMGK